MDTKPEPRLWATVTIVVAIIGCLGVLGAALISVLPNIISNSQMNQNSGNITPLPTNYSSDTTPLPTPTEAPALPPECSKLNLSPEECVNMGTHKYSILSSKILFDQSGQTCVADNNIATITINFFPNSFTYTDARGSDWEFTKKGNNLYEGGGLQPDGTFEWKNKITFTSNGLTQESSSYLVEGNMHLCTFFWEEKIVSSP